MGFDIHFLSICIFRIFLSFCAGFTLGIERKMRLQVVGLRTLILICEASTLLSILSIYIVKITGAGDSARIAAQVVSGIGFLGGGAIMRQGLNIKGLTSAAIIWAASAVGLAIGAGLYIPAGVCVLVAVLSLVVLERFEEKYFPAGRTKSLHLTFDSKTDEHLDMTLLKDTIERHGFIINDLNISKIIVTKMTILHYSVKAPKKDDFADLIDELGSVGNLTEFSITD